MICDNDKRFHMKIKLISNSHRNISFQRNYTVDMFEKQYSLKMIWQLKNCHTLNIRWKLKAEISLPVFVIIVFF